MLLIKLLFNFFCEFNCYALFVFAEDRESSDRKHEKSKKRDRVSY